MKDPLHRNEWIQNTVSGHSARDSGFFLYSSLDDDDAANNCKTELTQIEADSSLFLEITPPELDGVGSNLTVTRLPVLWSVFVYF